MDKTKVAAAIVCTALGVSASIFMVKLTISLAGKTLEEVIKAIPTTTN